MQLLTRLTAVALLFSFSQLVLADGIVACASHGEVHETAMMQHATSAMDAGASERDGAGFMAAMNPADVNADGECCEAPHPPLRPCATTCPAALGCANGPVLTPAYQLAASRHDGDDLISRIAAAVLPRAADAPATPPPRA